MRMRKAGLVVGAAAAVLGCALLNKPVPPEVCAVEPGLCASPAPTTTTTTTLAPSPSPRPSPSPQPIPSAAPSPIPSIGCRIPQGATWTKIPGARFQFEAKVAAAVSQVTGQTEEDDPVSVGSDAQGFFARVAEALRGAGLCAGQHENGKTDEICVGWTGDRCEGYHLYKYGDGTVIWPPKSDRDLWVSGPSTPEPSPNPSPGQPSPTPSSPPATSPAAVVSGEIKVSAATVRPGGSVEFTCAGKRADGKDAGPPDLFNESVRKGDPIGGWHFVVELQPGGKSEILRVSRDCPAGVIRVACTWYQVPRDFSTENLGVEVKP